MQYSYTDKIIKTIIKSTYSREFISTIFVMIITNIIRMHIDCYICYIIGSNFYICILSSTIVYFMNDFIYKIAYRFKFDIDNLILHLISNYDINNYKIWKRIFIFFICMYIYILTFLITFNNEFIKTTILQYICTYCIIEIIENKYEIKNLLKKNNKIINNDDFIIKDKDKDKDNKITKDIENSDEDNDEKFIFNDEFKLF